MKKNYTETGRTKQKLKTRNKILSSAQKFIAKGKDFSLEDISKDTSLSRATVYRYYSNSELLSREAALHLQTKSPESVVAPLETLSFDQKILGIQTYFNQLAFANEPAFRKFLSLVITSSSKSSTRGARRVQALRMALSDNLEVTPEDLEKLIVIATVLMGMEPVLVAKDVCQLNNEKTGKILQWGLQMVLDGIRAHKQFQ